MDKVTFSMGKLVVFSVTMSRIKFFKDDHIRAIQEKAGQAFISIGAFLIIVKVFKMLTTFSNV